LASELTRDETKIREVREVITQLQTLLAEHARRRDSAFGTMTPELQHVVRMAAKPEAEPQA
jgi:hypothetical protein